MTTTTNTTAKITNKDFYNAFKALANGEQISLTPEQISDWCDKKVEQLAKKAGSSSKPTKTQEENAIIKETILNVLRANGGYMTIKEIQSADASLTGLVNQRMSALLRQLGKDGTKQVTKITEKRVTRFKIAEEVEETSDEIEE